jgi:pimeloyl-ACP methyl ester carboxylesterase
MDEARYREAEAALFADAGIEPAERRIDLAAVGTTVRVLETGDGPPAVFFTGGPMAAATWAYVVAHAEGVRCLLVERPGTGLSAPLTAPPDVERFPGYLTELTRDVLDGLGLDRAALVGSSLGGAIALRSAAALPDRVDKVVLVGCPAFVPGWSQPRFFTLLRTPILGRLLLGAPVTRSSVRMGLRQMGHGRSLAAGRIPGPMLDWELAWQRDTDTMRNDAAMIVGLGSWRRGFDDRLDLDAADLARVEASCVLLLGTEDPVGAEPVGRRLGSLVPDLAVEMIEGAGHLPWLDDPVRIADRTAAFVLDPRSPTLRSR